MFIRRSIIRDGEVRPAIEDRRSMGGESRSTWLIVLRPPQSAGSPVRELAAAPVHAGHARAGSLARRRRRFLDLQAGSIWSDLRRAPPGAAGWSSTWAAVPSRTGRCIPPEATYPGIDYGRGRAHFGYSMPDTTYYEGDRWPVDDGSVDVVLCTETLEHVPDPSVFLAEASVPEARGAV